jgi:hypothetical protein
MEGGVPPLFEGGLVPSAGGAWKWKKTKTRMPVSRMMNCIGTLRNALKSRESRLSVREEPERYRWTWL